MNKQRPVPPAMAPPLPARPACSSNDDWNGDVVAERDTAVCVDREGRRVDDDRCSNDHYHGSGVASAFLWYYIGRNSAVPYYGDSIHDRRFAGRGTFTRSPGVQYARAPASTAMTRSRAVSRGGLGSSARSFGGSRS